eukprot:15183994-Heterocapsa_arctica.AAC.1
MQISDVQLEGISISPRDQVKGRSIASKVTTPFVQHEFAAGVGDHRWLSSFQQCPKIEQHEEERWPSG